MTEDQTFGFGLLDRFFNRPRLIGRGGLLKPDRDDVEKTPIPEPEPEEEPPIESKKKVWSENTARGYAKWITGSEEDPDFDKIFNIIHEKLKQREDAWRDSITEAWTEEAGKDD